MRHVWTSIASRLPRAGQCISRSEPFLRFAIAASTRCAGARQRTCVQSRGLARTPTTLSAAPRAASRNASRQNFTTSAILSLRNRPTRIAEKADVQTPSASKLEQAPTLASHTEGLPPPPEELTWRDYDPAGGMPIPGGERSPAQIHDIFGDEALDADTGNYILSVIHWRRLSGALIDVGLGFPRSGGVTQAQALRALEYVRSLAPEFDENAAAQVWVEEETLRQREILQERAFEVGLYKRDEEAALEEEEEEESQGTEYGRERNRESQLVRIREENEARHAEQTAAKAAAEAKAELAALATHRGPLELSAGVQPSIELTTYTTPAGISISRPKTTAWLQPTERKPWVKYYEERAHIIKDTATPSLSLLQRLGPSALFVLLILATALYTATNYTPPPLSARLWPDQTPAVATLTALTGTLCLFFLLTRFPPFWCTASKYLCIVPAYPYAISMLGSIFRHDSLRHLATCIAPLWLLGLVLHDDIGRGAFLSIFFASGAVGGLTTLAYNVLAKHWTVWIIGSSNAVFGVVAAACTLKPNGTIRFFGRDVPIAAWVFLALWISGELVAVRFGFRRVQLDHAGHVGGLLAGFVWGLWLRWERGREGLGREGLMEMRAAGPRQEGLVKVEGAEAELEGAV